MGFYKDFCLSPFGFENPVKKNKWNMINRRIMKDRIK